ncbi:MAG: hypothetical protein WD738_11190 [Pirellulales bacterium]
MLRALVSLIVGLQFLAVWPCSSTSALAAPAVWSGLTFTFSKAAFADPALAENQDHITDDVWFTRGDSRGLLNAFSECPLGFCSYIDNFSPEGTAWATDVMAANAGKTIAATNWGELVFTDWQTAYGNSVGNFIIGEDAVVHLIGDEDDVDDDIYLDIRFSEWGTAPAGGPFSYMRAEPPAQPPTTGDYNGNGVVDTADFVIWRKTLNQPANPFGSGADGDMDGTIDPGDYDFWAARFGNTVPGSGGGAVNAAVPEPATGVLLFLALLLIAGFAPPAFPALTHK